jgi:hypothetical protein
MSEARLADRTDIRTGDWVDRQAAGGGAAVCCG